MSLLFYIFKNSLLIILIIIITQCTIYCSILQLNKINSSDGEIYINDFINKSTNIDDSIVKYKNNSNERVLFIQNDLNRSFNNNNNNNNGFDKNNKTKFIDKNNNNYLVNLTNSGNEKIPNYTAVEFSFFDKTIIPPEEKPQCILESKSYLSWWIGENGILKKYDNISEIKSLDLSYRNGSTTDLTLDIEKQQKISTIGIIILSLAHNYFKKVPLLILLLVRDSLQYLSLLGNMFTMTMDQYTDEDLWTTFPDMPLLKELDLRNCAINILPPNSFEKLPKLEKLFLQQNKIFHVHDEAFARLINLKHLDLSFNNYSTGGSGHGDPYDSIIEGLLIKENTFTQLKKLEFLDLSHTKISSNSIKAFTEFHSKLEMLSLCYTGFSILPFGIFNKTNLKVLDLSGNPLLSTHLTQNTFDSLKKLEILSFENSNIKYLDFITLLLKNLRILSMKGNNINQISNQTFGQLENLEIMDLSSNHLSNWYYEVFQNNSNLKVLNLRDNNINIMTSSMLNDFKGLQFLAIGHNSFICHCNLKEFIEKAARNNCNVNCTVVPYTVPNKGIFSFLIPSHENSYLSHAYSNIFNKYYKNIQNSYNNMEIYKDHSLDLQNNNNQSSYEDVHINLTRNVRMFCNRTIETEDECPDLGNINDDLDIGFQLLDFNESDYNCINSTSNTGHNLIDLEYCTNGRNSEINDELDKAKSKTIIIISIVVVGIIFFLIYITCYFNWWYIRYFLILLKNATILSFLDKEKDFVKVDDDTGFIYDVFVSYCDENRDWVLNEFIPNMEGNDEINVCLHERDFHVGLTILENIISCMDKSRALLLIVSQSFLLSHWCQFEMHLAQHRLIETRRENLIIILLEDIPKRKRPKTLHYLMKIKTYIKWPTGNLKNPLNCDNKLSIVPDKLLIDERKLFWKRLKKSLITTRNGLSDLNVNNRRVSSSHV